MATTGAKRLWGFVYDDVVEQISHALMFTKYDIEDFEAGKRSAEEVVDRTKINLEIIERALDDLRKYSF